MTVKIGRFEMPKIVVKDERTATRTYARFMAEPLESGYGHTLGNSLRRVLLSSLEGAAISAIKMEGAFHEFCAVPGVVEDVTDVILNLKKVLLKMYCREPRKVRIKVKGPGEVTAANIETDQFVEVVNPLHYICTLAEDGKFEAELEISLGRGYSPADWKEKKEQEIGVIPIDCIYSPVLRVNYKVENVRVGRRTDYEKLIMEIWTDERITPDEAMIRSAAILRHHLDVFVNYDEDLIEFEQNEKKEQEIGVIPIDCIYSPVLRVNYKVENVRVGRRTDYEKLIMDIWTDERITPDEAMIRSAAILRHHLDVFVNYDEDLIEFEKSEKSVDIDRESMRKKLNMSVNEIELSVRAANCLNNANILTVGELAMKTEADMLKYRNFGKKSLLEIEEKLHELGLAMGIKIDADLLTPRPAAAADSVPAKKE